MTVKIYNVILEDDKGVYVDQYLLSPGDNFFAELTYKDLSIKDGFLALKNQNKIKEEDASKIVKTKE